MSLYTLIHIHEGTVEAVFVFPDAHHAIDHGVNYARRSGFFVAGDPDAESYARRYMVDHHCLISDVNEDDQLIIKRAFTVEGSLTRVP